jgi:hypothetical protein
MSVDNHAVVLACEGGRQTLDADLAVVLRWLREYVSRPSPLLGRRGPVCPFVPPALDGDAVRFSFHYEFGQGPDPDPDQLRAVLVEELARFRQISAPPGPSGRSLASLLVVLPRTDLVGWAAIDQVYVDLKNHAVQQGLMIGQFHSGCDERAARNRAFAVSRSPIALVAIRHMAPHDLLFLHERRAWFAVYQQRFGGDVNGGRLRDAFLRKLYHDAVRRHGLDDRGSTPPKRCRANPRSSDGSSVGGRTARLGHSAPGRTP